MILVIDVGNTNITFGVYDGEELVSTFRMMSNVTRTSDEYGMMITGLLDRNGVKVDDINGAIVSSVVPNVMHALNGAVVKYVKTKVLEVGPGVKTGIKIITENPREIGADRIVDAVGAYEKYGGPVLVLDFGTATTYDLITADGSFAAGITAPGIKISAKCCEVSKKRPLYQYIKENGIDLNVTGERKAEGGIRATAHHSCFEQSKNHVDKYMPLWWWSDRVKSVFKEREGIRYSDCYEVYGMRRTGCVGCPFSLTIADDLTTMYIFEPQLYKACMKVFGESYRLVDQFGARKRKCIPDLPEKLFDF